MLPLMVEAISLDKLAVEGRVLSEGNAERFKELLVDFVPWIDNVEVSIIKPGYFTLALGYTTKFISASIEHKFEMLDELANKIGHYVGVDTKNTILNVANLAA